MSSGKAEPALRKIAFTESLLDRVRDFHCGDQPWELEVSDWIRAEPGNGGALDELAKGRCEAWLYENEEGDIVGFASLGCSNWRYPSKQDQRKQVSVIPYVAVSFKFQRRGYFKGILSHLFFEAKRSADRLPLIGLHVDPRNEGAIAVYHRYGLMILTTTIMIGVPA